MLEIFGLIENIAKYFSSVLITGETGTGKEVVAQAIHGLSPYKDKPLTVCDCASSRRTFSSPSFSATRKGLSPGRQGQARSFR